MVFLASLSVGQQEGISKNITEFIERYSLEKPSSLNAVQAADSSKFTIHGQKVIKEGFGIGPRWYRYSFPKKDKLKSYVLEYRHPSVADLQFYLVRNGVVESKAMMSYFKEKMDSYHIGILL